MGNNFNSNQSSKNFFKKPQGCPVCLEKKEQINFKDLEFLGKFVSEGGRILPSRVTNVCIKHQRYISKSIKRARILALMPFVFNVNVK
ncbi:MAG: 30S ribosomal protein S18 [Rickettsia sp.]|nr:30S ribosomal protein S18 [Rickettsia sp.]